MELKSIENDTATVAIRIADVESELEPAFDPASSAVSSWMCLRSSACLNNKSALTRTEIRGYANNQQALLIKAYTKSTSIVDASFSQKLFDTKLAICEWLANIKRPKLLRNSWHYPSIIAVSSNFQRRQQQTQDDCSIQLSLSA